MQTTTLIRIDTQLYASEHSEPWFVSEPLSCSSLGHFDGAPTKSRLTLTRDFLSWLEKYYKSCEKHTSNERIDNQLISPYCQPCLHKDHYLVRVTSDVGAHEKCQGI
jgi:hypothetical protein